MVNCMRLFLNKNVIVFIAFALAVIIGLFGNCAFSLASNAIDALNKLKEGHIKNYVLCVTDDYLMQLKKVSE